MRFLFIEKGQRSGDRVTLDQERSHYVRTVLRLRPGDALDLVDAEGSERVDAVVAQSLRGRVTLECRASRPLPPPPRPAVILALALSKGEHFEIALRQAVEIGAARLLPLETARSVRRVEGKDWEQKAKRWRRLAAAACQQSGRPWLPEIERPCPLEEALRIVPGKALSLFFSTEVAQAVALADLPPVPEAGAVVWIGPEGGFTDEETAACLARGATAVRLQEAVLRCDTAAAVALAAVMDRAGRL